MPATLRWTLGTRQGRSKLRKQEVSFCWPLEGVDIRGILILFKCTTVKGTGRNETVVFLEKKNQNGQATYCCENDRIVY